MHLHTQHTCTGSLLSSSCVDAVSACSHHTAECADGHICLVEQALEPSHLSTKGMRLCFCLRSRAQALWEGRQVKTSAHASQRTWDGSVQEGVNEMCSTEYRQLNCCVLVRTGLTRY